MANTRLNRGLIVSCQATEGEPLYGCGIMHLFARAAKAGGACGIRALVGDVADIKREVSLPVIGLVKRVYEGSEIYITATKKEVDELLKSECDVICMDATLRKRPNGETLKELYDYARANAGGRELMADISTLEEALAAEETGFDYISTTLRGYTPYTASCPLPDIEFMGECKKHLKRAKLIAEGGIFEAGHMEKVSKIEPYAVVVGSAITRPKVITERLAGALRIGK
ncbi:MAG: N-acetylmannosamine-6-phosphate 2-epimerase [Ruminococcus flavefaciens]|nr:N-acetylmannosamine-6-phosphate 2-epimerase [Ruminococcus flavefaciens]